MGMKLTPGKHWGMRRLADRDGFCRIVATDQREILAEPLAEILGVEVAPYEAVAGVVTALASELSPEASALLIDPIYGYLPAVKHIDPAKGLLLSYESVDMVQESGGLKEEPIPDWSVAKIRSLGADAVKVLVLYRADASAAVRHFQENFVQTAGEACERCDIPMLLEVLVYPTEGESPEDFAELVNISSSRPSNRSAILGSRPTSSSSSLPGRSPMSRHPTAKRARGCFAPTIA